VSRYAAEVQNYIFLIPLVLLGRIFGIYVITIHPRYTHARDARHALKLKFHGTDTDTDTDFRDAAIV